MTGIAFVGNNFSGDVSATGNVSAGLRVAAAQFANGLEPDTNDLGAYCNTFEWVAFDPSSVGLNRARGSLAIEVDTNPPVVWLKQSPGGGLPTGWVALASGATPEAATSIQWNAVNTLGAPPGSPVATTTGGSAAVQLANAGAAETAQCCGLYVSGTIVFQAGLFMQTAAQWNAVVTGASTGLTPGAQYWLDTADGMLTSVAPAGSGDYDTFVGYALSAAELVVMPAPPVGPL